MAKKRGCVRGRHEVDRQQIWHDGIDFRSICAICRAPLVRETRGWGAFIADGKARQPAPETAMA